MEDFKYIIEGRNPVTEALRSGRAIDKIYVKKRRRHFNKNNRPCK